MFTKHLQCVNHSKLPYTCKMFFGYFINLKTPEMLLHKLLLFCVVIEWTGLVKSKLYCNWVKLGSTILSLLTVRRVYVVRKEIILLIWNTSN